MTRKERQTFTEGCFLRRRAPLFSLVKSVMVHDQGQKILSIAIQNLKGRKTRDAALAALAGKAIESETWAPSACARSADSSSQFWHKMLLTSFKFFTIFWKIFSLFWLERWPDLQHQTKRSLMSEEMLSSENLHSNYLRRSPHTSSGNNLVISNQLDSRCCSVWQLFILIPVWEALKSTQLWKCTMGKKICKAVEQAGGIFEKKTWKEQIYVDLHPHHSSPGCGASVADVLVVIFVSLLGVEVSLFSTFRVAMATQKPWVLKKSFVGFFSEIKYGNYFRS